MEKLKKQKVVEDLGARLKQLNFMFLTDYSGMNVAQVTRLRRELRNVGVEFNVVKNTLLRIAARGTKADMLKDQFYGPNAIISIFTDPVVAAKVLAGVAKEMPHLKMKAGFLGDKVITAEDIVKLATVPPREVLVAKLLGLLQGTPQRLVYVLSGNLSKLVMTLNAIKTKKEEG